jgi:hypothetical protein
MVTKKMWYGMNATVVLGPGFLHRAGYGFFLLPHPPLVNAVLRYKLPEDAQKRLSITHEFAHLQTTPIALLYTVLVFYFAFWRLEGLTLETIVILLVSTHAAWEMLAEAVTILTDRNGYSVFYKAQSIIPRAMFWFITGMLVFYGWYMILK